MVGRYFALTFEIVDVWAARKRIGDEGGSTEDRARIKPYQVSLPNGMFDHVAGNSRLLYWQHVVEALFFGKMKSRSLFARDWIS